MQICSEGHDEICHEGVTCPACELLEAVDGLEDELTNAQDEIDDLNNQLAEAT